MVHEQLELHLSRDPTSAGYARRQVSDFCAGLSPEVREAALLLASELVTNALRHGEGSIGMHMTVDSSALRVEVTDDSPDPPRRMPPSADGTGGRGVFLVDRLASDWGITAHPGDGKAVWFTLLRR